MSKTIRNQARAVTTVTRWDSPERLRGEPPAKGALERLVVGRGPWILMLWLVAAVGGGNWARSALGGGPAPGAALEPAPGRSLVQALLQPLLPPLGQSLHEARHGSGHGSGHCALGPALTGALGGRSERTPLTRLEGWADAPLELVGSAARGRPPGFGASVSFVAASPGGPGLLIGAPAGLSVSGGGLVLGAARGGDGPAWRVGGLASWWPGPSGGAGVPGPMAPPRGDDEQGRVLASAGGWAALGAPSARIGGAQTGAVTLVFFRPGGGLGTTAQILQPPAGTTGGGFGAALAFLEVAGEPTALAVGAPYETDPGTGLPVVGAVHLFEPVGGAGGAAHSRWRFVRTVRPASPGIGMSFGAALAWVDGALAIGAPGHGSLAPGAGSVVGVSTSGDRLWSLRSSEAGARFGATLCALPVAWGAGQPGLAVTAVGRGMVHVHDLWAGVPQEVTALRGRPGGGFGLTLAAVEGQLLVGAPFEGARGVPLAGQVKRFLAGQGTVPVETLSAPSPTIGGEFGASLAATFGRDGVRRLAVGEPGSHHGCTSTATVCRPGRVAVFVLP